jgi:hypothetical protein
VRVAVDMGTNSLRQVRMVPAEALVGKPMCGRREEASGRSCGSS